MDQLSGALHQGQTSTEKHYYLTSHAPAAEQLVVRQILNDGWEGGEASTRSTRASRVVFGALAKDLRRTKIDTVFGEGDENTYGGAAAPQRTRIHS